MRAKPALCACLLALGLAGCGTADRERDAAAVAERFHAALEARDGAAACAELDPETASKRRLDRVCRRLRADRPRAALRMRAGGLTCARCSTSYENSLVLVMGSAWIGTWLAQSVTGVIQYNGDRLDHREDPVAWSHYLTSPDFWANTLQNWQSEFLAVGSMAILSVYLRQRGSPESKPVGAPHSATGVGG